MTYYANLAPSDRFAVPSGYPIALSSLTETQIEGVVRPKASTVAADVVADSTATVILAAFTMPATVGAADGAEVARETVEGIGTQSVTVTLTLPTDSIVPSAYVVRLWIEDAPGTDGVSVSDMRVA